MVTDKEIAIYGPPGTGKTTRLLDIMEEASQQAISNGMTPEILESILND